MSEPTPLDYSDGCGIRPVSRAAILALLVGLLCGPAAIGVAIALMECPPYLLHLGGAVLLVIIWHVASFVFSATVYFRLKRRSSARGRYLALIGIISTFGWAVTLVDYTSQYK